MIFYAVSLNNRLRRLRADKDQLEALSKDFNQSTIRVEESMARLRQAAADVQIQIGRTETLRDDLKFLGDRGVSTADRLEELVREARDNLGVDPASTNRVTSHASAGSLREKSQQSDENYLSWIKHYCDVSSSRLSAD